MSGRDFNGLGDVPLDNAAWRAVTEEPRRYGFHATLKAPFRLGGTFGESDLLAAAGDFAQGLTPFHVPRLRVACIGRFIALVPAEPAPELEALAAACVRAFEPFRAPLEPADLARRLASPLSARQRRLLDEWGYPYVFDEFRFHMTLTGALPEDDREGVRADLARRYESVPPGLPVDAITVFRQEHRHGRFRVLRRFGFGG